MKIGIDARFWGHAGPGRYVKNLILALQEIDRENEYVVFLNSKRTGNFSVIPDLIWNLTEKFCQILKPVQDEKTFRQSSGELRFSNLSFKRSFVNVSWYSFAEQLRLPFIFGRENLDLLHVPFFNIPIFYPGKIAVTIHDLTIHRFSTARATTRWLPFNLLKRLIYRFVFLVALKRSTVIFTPTEFVKQDLLREYGWLDESKIIITYEGVGLLNPKSEIRNPKQIQNSNDQNFKKRQILASYDVEEPYFLYVGSMYPHKNLKRLVEAFRIVSEEYPELSLVLVGKLDYFQRRLKKEIEINEYEILNKTCVVFPAFTADNGYVSDEDLAVLYENALAFVFPSLSEGFGLPPLEAMQFGTPVCASSVTAVPEVCGDAALYFDPGDVEDIAAKLKGIVKNSKLRKELVRKGYKNLERFSWEKMAKKTLDGYRKVTEI